MLPANPAVSATTNTIGPVFLSLVMAVPSLSSIADEKTVASVTL
jgi:hypothetical protein